MRVEIPPALMDRIRVLAAESVDGRETGGILLGHGPTPDGTIRVAHAGDPGPEAVRREDFFLRDLQHSRLLAAQAWLTDGSEWVGEWHTHPTGGGKPSELDMHTYATVLASTPALGVFLSIILTPGPGESDWSSPQTHTWVVTAHRDADVLATKPVDARSTGCQAAHLVGRYQMPVHSPVSLETPYSR